MKYGETRLGMKSLPYHSHQLSSNDGVAAVGTNTKVKLYIYVCIARDITDHQGLIVEICGDDLVIKKHMNAVVQGSLFQQTLVE
jgi:hypothetical protein